MLKGSCLCGGIRFEITGNHSKIGACHCSLCRKCSGVGSTAVITISFEQLRWVSGKELVMTFERPSGYGSAFCRVCGSPAPDTDREQTMYAVPVGLLDDDPPLEFGDHIYVGSKANWDVIGDDAPQFDEDGPPRPRDQVARGKERARRRTRPSFKWIWNLRRNYRLFWQPFAEFASPVA